MTKYCVFYLIAARLLPEHLLAQGELVCDESKCAMWNEYVGRCGLIATGIIQGIEVSREEESPDADDVFGTDH